VALQAGLGADHGITLLETEDQPRLPALGFQVSAGRSVACLALLPPVDIMGKGLDVILVARHADFVIVDVLGPWNHRRLPFDLLIRDLGKEVIPFGPARIQIGFGPLSHLVRRSA
jgi:hypothetical protein